MFSTVCCCFFIFVFSSITLLINITDVNRKTIISPDIKSDIDDHTLSLFLSFLLNLSSLLILYLSPSEITSLSMVLTASFWANASFNSSNNL